MILRRHLVLAGLAGLAARTGAFAAPPSPASAGAPADWVVASPESQGISGAALEQILEAGNKIASLRSLIVVRNGVLIAERYYAGASASDLIAVQSVTKSVSSMLVGLAVQQGRISSLSQTLGDLLPELFAKASNSVARAVTLGQVLTGTTGIAYTERANSWLASLPDPALFVAGPSGDAAAPPHWSYNDAAIALLAPVLVRAVGMPLEDYARRALFSPLGIETLAWDRDASGNPTTYAGLKLTPRDLAKIAWTMADAGRWSGRQVLAADWVKDSTRFHVPVAQSWRLGPMSDNGYGYLWFTGTLKGRPVAWAWGFGAQFAMIVPSLKLAIVTLGSHLNILDIRTLNIAVMHLVAQVEELAA
jgi:CubicO group peptidase (beta-lactamase class C family)